jgi:cytochrome c-type biogenesis protein CcmH
MPRILFFSFLLFWTGLSVGHAVHPREVLPDPSQEARAREISAQLRCLVCQNESIDESNADLAQDLRVLIRERIVQGDTNEIIKSYLVSRYGDFILLNPPFKPLTYLLWFCAPLILLFGGLFLYRAQRQPVVTSPPLNEEEEEQLQQLLPSLKKNNLQSKTNQRKKS